MVRGLAGGNRLGSGVTSRLRARRRGRSGGRRPCALLGSVLIASLAVSACGSDDEPVAAAPGLFDIVRAGDYEPASTLSELADRSDRVAMGTIVDVEEGWRFGDAPDDPASSRMIELIVESGEPDGPIHVVWPYVHGYEIDAIRESMPIGAPVVLYLSDFRTIADEPGWYHLGPDDQHTHWMLTTPQGIVLADSEAGVAVLGDPSAPFNDAPSLDAEFTEWVADVPSEG